MYINRIVFCELRQVTAELRGGKVTLRLPEPGFFSRIFSSSPKEETSTTLTKEQLDKIYEIVEFDKAATAAKADVVLADDYLKLRVR